MVDTLLHDTALICEGHEECALVRKMICEGLVRQMDLIPIGSPGKGMGIDGLRDCLKAISGLSGFSDLRHIGILADADNDPSAMFKKIRSQIQEANQHQDIHGMYSVPDAAYSRTEASYISLVVILSPGIGKSGCLETLLLGVLGSLNKDAMCCVDEFVTCAGINDASDGWSLSKIDKAKVRAIISVLHKRNPALALSYLWNNAPELIPVTHSTLNDLVAALNEV